MGFTKCNRFFSMAAWKLKCFTNREMCDSRVWWIFVSAYMKLYLFFSFSVLKVLLRRISTINLVNLSHELLIKILGKSSVEIYLGWISTNLVFTKTFPIEISVRIIIYNSRMRQIVKAILNQDHCRSYFLEVKHPCFWNRGLKNRWLKTSTFLN